MTPREEALARLKAAQAAGWPDGQAALDDVERAMGGEPSTRPIPSRLSAAWYAWDIGGGFSLDEERLVAAALEACAAERERVSRALSADEPRGARDRRAWAALARHKAGPAIELARLLLETAGLDPRYASPLLDEAESVEDVLRAVRAHVRIVRRNEEVHARKELRVLAGDLLRQRFPDTDTREARFAVGKSGTAEIVAGLRRLLLEAAESPDGLFPGRPPATEGAATVSYSVEDGPGSSDVVRLEVLVMRGTARSTVAVIDERSGRSLSYEVADLGEEASSAGLAVMRAVRDMREGP